MRLNRQYRAEASVLEMSRTERPELAKHTRLRVFVFVDSVDLAEVEALRYGKGLHADELHRGALRGRRRSLPLSCRSAGSTSSTTPSCG